VFYRKETRRKSDENLTQNGRKSDENLTQIRRKSSADKRKLWIIKQLKSKTKLKSHEIREYFKITRETASKDLQILIDEGKIVKKGGEVIYGMN